MRATTIATRTNPSFGGALVWAAIAFVPWIEQHQHAIESAPIVQVAASPELGFEPLADRIVLNPWDHVDNPKLDPSRHPDARPYPQGMVFGMGAPSVDPGMLLSEPADVPFPSVATVLSAFLGPWSALAGLRGT